MSITIEEVSTITAKSQAIVPKAVRKAQVVDYGERVAFSVSDDVVTACCADIDQDLAIETFLGFLASDIKARPQPALPWHIKSTWAVRAFRAIRRGQE